VLLPEDDVLFWTGQRPPTPHAPFQRAPDAGADLGVAPPELFENRNGADAGGRLQDRDDLAIPNIGKWVGPAPGVRTRNLPLTAIRSFFRFVSFEEPIGQVRRSVLAALHSLRLHSFFLGRPYTEFGSAANILTQTPISQNID
jgi:hypothetical protein